MTYIGCPLCLFSVQLQLLNLLVTADGVSLSLTCLNYASMVDQFIRDGDSLEEKIFRNQVLYIFAKALSGLILSWSSVCRRP